MRCEVDKRIGETWTADDDLAVRAALGMD